MNEQLDVPVRRRRVAGITFKIFFFMDHPFLGVEFSIFNMQRTDPTVSRITDGVGSHQSQFGPIAAALTAAVVILGATSAATAQQTPQYQVGGFPITPHQMLVLQPSARMG
jgi:hypothetical protein